MPNYVTITPKYQVVDLADMLKVPEMITRETKEANKEIEDYKDQISKNRALLGPDADKIFSPYDDLMNTLIDNPTVADRQHIANQLRSRYRDINAKVEAAKPKYDKMTEMFMQHPDYIGNPGSFIDYYNNPNYTPTVVDGAKIAADSAKAMKSFVAKMMPKRIGTLEGDKTKDVYGRGYTPDELSAFVDDAVSGRLQTPEGRTLASILEKNGYGNLQTDAERARAQNYLKQGVAEGFMTTDVLPNAVEQAKLNARYSGSRSGGSGGRGKEVETTFMETDKNSENWTGEGPRYEYKIKRNTESGRVTSIKRRPLKKNEKNKWVPAENEFKDAPKEAEVWNVNARLHSYTNKDAQYTFYDEGDLPDMTPQKKVSFKYAYTGKGASKVSAGENNDGMDEYSFMQYYNVLKTKGVRANGRLLLISPEIKKTGIVKFRKEDGKDIVIDLTKLENWRKIKKDINEHVDQDQDAVLVMPEGFSFNNATSVDGYYGILQPVKAIEEKDEYTNQQPVIYTQNGQSVNQWEY